MDNPIKTCSRCKQELPLNKFGNDKSRRDGKRRYCHECQSAYQRQYTQKNPGKKREYDIRSWENNKERYRRYQRDYARTRRATDEEFRLRYLANGKRFRLRHPDRVTAYYREYAAANPQKRREKNARRKARMQGVAINLVDYRAILKRDGMVCHICGEPAKVDEIHFVHIVPLSRGGTHSESNIAVAHSTCNLRKGSKLLHEYWATIADENNQPERQADRFNP